MPISISVSLGIKQCVPRVLTTWLVRHNNNNNPLCVGAVAAAAVAAAAAAAAAAAVIAELKHNHGHIVPRKWR